MKDKTVSECKYTFFFWKTPLFEKELELPKNVMCNNLTFDIYRYINVSNSTHFLY